MRVGLITPDPGHPLLAATAALLAPAHAVEVLDPARGAAAAGGALADVYLLKARTPSALELAAELERRGAPVVNSAAATGRCQDRTTMAALARRAGLPFAATRTFASAAGLAARAAGLPWPLVVKSRRSRKDDLVARVDDPDALREVASRWAVEPVVVQEFAPNSGFDHKVWVVGDQVFAGLRRSELAAGGKEPAPTLERLPDGWAAVALRVGGVFGLDVYGVDLIDTGDADPLVVDINAFPGIRGQAGAPEALAALALRRARTAPSPG
ncbi:alpha-L-glutamate ligase [Streptomyces sp. NBC_00249]|uniref:ATP-grasp domain-containing protein n=1 Tax=Streptomyces sp. NBC_00249 TaxID=2975690 RepID=UPI0022597D6D|nr:alpha-L-glutamate ligase [Streptomyces sp. NBC_00249]MCX5195197.1 alpha-L-glutamate ligase [Streptomyces sp. NBC_00249]